MSQSGAETVDAYLRELPPDRQEALAAVRKIILDNLPEGYAEVMQHGMICYVIPLADNPVTYNGQPLVYAALASQKHYMALYLMNVYSDRETESWFVEQFQASGKRLDMGKSCVRFKSLEALPLELIGRVVARTPAPVFLARYEAARSERKSDKKTRSRS